MKSNLIHLMLLLPLPALILFLEKRIRVIRWLSPIVVCYIIGIVVGNMPFVSFDHTFLRLIAELSVCLATPMLLFSCDFLKWLHHSKNSLISFSLGTIAVVIVSFLAFLIFNEHVVDGWKVAGMTVGLYTGATVNLTAIGIALDVNEETFIVLNSADLLFGGIYFFFLITMGKRALGLFLPRFSGYHGKGSQDGGVPDPDPENTPIKKIIREISVSLGISSGILAVATGASYLILGKISSTIIILAITTCGIALSFNQRIRRLRFNYATGDYLLLIFALALGSLASYSDLVSGNLSLVLFCAVVVFGSVTLHLLASFFFGLDDDTVIITSAAVMYGPAFILPIAGAIRNREIVVAGLSLALLGNAFGTYLGIGLAYLLKYFF
jgi:uncharacterized membrane protein